MSVERGGPAVCNSSDAIDRKSTRLNSSHLVISYAVFCLKKIRRVPRSTQTPLHRPRHHPPATPRPHVRTPPPAPRFVPLQNQPVSSNPLFFFLNVAAPPAFPPFPPPARFST